MLLGKRTVGGQGYTEYIVLLAGVLALAGVVYYVLGGLRTKYQAAGDSIDSLPEAGPIGGP